MRLPGISLILVSAALAAACSREPEKEPEPSALERAQAKLEQSMDTAEQKFAEGTAEAKKMLAAALERWEELRPEAERAVASIEQRVERLMQDSESLKRLPPETLEKIRARLASMREKLAEANAAHEQGNTDLAVEKADEVQKESAAVEELLVENPDPPSAR